MKMTFSFQTNRYHHGSIPRRGNQRLAFAYSYTGKYPRIPIVSCKCNGSRIMEFGYLTDFDSSYEIGELLGSGSFSSVYAATQKSTGEKLQSHALLTKNHYSIRFAVKVIPKMYDGSFLSKHCTKHVQHEVDILNKLGASLNIAYLYGVYESSTNVHMVMELCSGGPMLSVAHKENYSERDAARVVQDMLRAIAQCHSKNIIMRDVKPENFLFLNKSKRSPLKAIDFGLALYGTATSVFSSRAGTPMYIAPEVLKRAYGQRSDLWSAGVIAYQLLTGRMPFLTENGKIITRSMMEKHLFSNKDMFRAVLYSKIDFGSKTWRPLSHASKDFVKSLLQRDPRYRPTAQEALQHKWLQEGLDESGAGALPVDSSVVQRLQRFGTYGKLKQAALKKVAAFVAADPFLVKDLKAAFANLDSTGNGRVSNVEIAKLLSNGNFDMSATEIQQLLAQIQDADSNGYVDYTTWLAAIIDWKQLQESPVWESWIQEVFHAFDVDNIGQLTREELTNVLCGEYCEIPDTVPSVLRDVDTNGDGLVSLEDFLKIMEAESSDKLDIFDARQHINES